MAYERVNFTPGETLKAAELNHIEDGLQSLSEEIDNIKENGGAGLPDGGAPHQYLVTDENGVAKWEEKAAFIHRNIIEYLVEPTDVVMQDEYYMGGVVGHGPEIGASEFQNVWVMCDGITYFFETATQVGGSGSSAAFGMVTDEFMIISGAAPFPIEIVFKNGRVGDVHNIAIYRGKETIKTFDPRLLKHACIDLHMYADGNVVYSLKGMTYNELRSSIFGGWFPGIQIRMFYPEDKETHIAADVFWVNEIHVLNGPITPEIIIQLMGYTVHILPDNTVTEENPNT